MTDKLVYVFWENSKDVIYVDKNDFPPISPKKDDVFILNENTEYKFIEEIPLSDFNPINYKGN